MVRIIPKQEHTGLLDWDSALEAARQALIEYSEHPRNNVPRQRLHSSSGTRISTFQAVCSSLDAAGLNTHTEHIHPDEDRSIKSRSAYGVHILHEDSTGDLLAIFLGRFAAAEVPTGASGFRTACIGAVGLENLLREDATDVAVIGSGATAANHVLALSHVRTLETGQVFSPTLAHREIFAERIGQLADIDLQAVDDVESAVEGADLVLACTNASKPVFDGELLEPGQTVYSLVGGSKGLVDEGLTSERRREIDNAAVAKADVIATSSIEHARDHEQGDLWIPVQEGVITWDELVNVRDVVAAKHPGRERDDQITLYKNNCGIGIVDIALTRAMWDRVVEEDLGIDVPVYQLQTGGLDYTAVTERYDPSRTM